jgi:2-iminobutanoate/2-iminopropanoate deaminase
MQTRRINAVNAIEALGGGYSQAFEVTDPTRILFVSGQVPVDPKRQVPDGFPAQCRQAWANVEAQLRAAGMTLDNVVKVTTFLANREYGMLNRGVRRQVLGDRCPASTTIVADIFDSEWLVEIEAIAAA